MESMFKLSALGMQPGEDPQAVRVQLQPLLKGDAAALADIFHRISVNEQVVLGTNLPKDKAERFLEKLTDIGLKCRLDPIGLSLMPLADSEYTCPACAHRQPLRLDNTPDICERCGIVGRNYDGASDLKRLVEIERQRLQTIKDQAKAKPAKSEQDKTHEQYEKLRALAQRQAEKELGITPMTRLKVKLNALREQQILFKIVGIGGLTAGLVGVGLLVWQFVFVSPKAVATLAASDAPQSSGLQITVKPAPDAVFKVEDPTSSATPAGADAEGVKAGAPGATVIAANAPLGTTPDGRSATGDAGLDAAPVAAEVNTLLDGSAPPLPPQSLLDASQLALAHPVAESASGQRAAGDAAQPPVRNPQIMNQLALYQLAIDDVAAATGSAERAMAWLGRQDSPLSSRQLDQFNRFQVDIHARIASQHFNRQESAIAQTQWLQATHLANSIVTPDERAQAFSKLACTLHEVQASTAKDYFGRALETMRLVADPMSQVVALSAVGRDLARTGQRQQSQDLFSRA
ncbi:MAG: hypothetical protein KDI50_09150, partial [Candidatus Competibacteraceae bacterium]|nr:hypothetical protein [Candidatus Competibacteraceae bacterium]